MEEKDLLTQAEETHTDSEPLAGQISLAELLAELRI